MATYWEKLKDPRWQRRRLEVMELADFACAECSATEQTLHVHHKLYRKGANPWEYTDDELACLCEACHERVTHVRQRLDIAIAKLSSGELEQVVGFAEGLNAFSVGPDIDQHVHLTSWEHASGVSAAFQGIDPDDVIGSRDDSNKLSFAALYDLHDARKKRR